MEQPNITRAVGTEIARLRKLRGWSAEQLAQECTRFGPPSMDRSKIAKIENGHRRRVGLDEVQVLARALGVPVEQLTDPRTITVLHLSDLRVDARGTRNRLLGACLADVLALDVRPDLVVVTGDLASAGGRTEFEQVRSFLDDLTGQLEIGYDRVAVVPGDRDVNLAACLSYFAQCEADDQTPRRPYWPKWRHFVGLFAAWPDQGQAVRMEAEQPWALFRIDDLRLVIAGFNSTIEDCHLDPDRHGALGQEQIAWFDEQLREYERKGWFRLGLMHHRPAGGAPTDMLRDPAELGVLSSRVNLLLHGHPTPDDDRMRKLANGLAVSAAGAHTGPDGEPSTSPRYSLLRITAGGVHRAVRRYMPDGRWQPVWKPSGDGPWTERFATSWTSVHEAFPASATRPVTVGAPPTTDDGWHANDRTRLLDEIADVCTARHARATVQRFGGRVPYLRVTYPEGRKVRQVRIGAASGRFDQTTVNTFLDRVHPTGDNQTELIYRDFEPAQELHDYAALRNVTLRSFIDFQGLLLDLEEYVSAQTTLLTRDAAYRPESYVPQRWSEFGGRSTGEQGDLVGHLIDLVHDPRDGQFVLLLGDFGRGKTFALHELARRLPELAPHLTPIFIELRALDKTHSIEGLVAAHLADRGYSIELRAFRHMHAHGRLVLIFDGFDELVARATYERATDHLRTLLEAARTHSKIIIASRTQHFLTDSQVLTAMGDLVEDVPRRHVLSVSPLAVEQMYHVLLQRYGDDDLATARLNLLQSIPELHELASNPRMLTFIADLPEEWLRAVVASGDTISAATLYREILDQWLRHEHQRTQGIPGVPAGPDVEELWDGIMRLALRMWETGERLIDIGRLDEFAGTLDSILSTEQLTHTLGSGSLLVRTDEGMFAFIHDSVQEWLIARYVAEVELTRWRSDAGRTALDRQRLSQLSVRFLCDLADSATLRAWADRYKDDPSASGTARANAGACLARLNIGPAQNMHRAMLRGEDLSYRDWKGVDLSEADLTGARLSNTDLSGSRLRGARLDHTVLDSTNLSGADLTDASLTRARLTRTDLRNAVLTRTDLSHSRLVDVDLSGAQTRTTRWWRTALIRTTAAAPELDRARGQGAAVIPGEQQVRPEMLPHALGVRFGFQEGRVPKPSAYDSGGSLIALGNEDGSVLLCDASTGIPLRTLTGHTLRTYAVMFNPDPGNPQLATASLDGSVRLWDMMTGNEARKLEQHDGPPWPLVYSRTGEYLVSGDNAGRVRIWRLADAVTGGLYRTLDGHTGPVWTASFQPGGPLLAVGDDTQGGASVRIWDIRTGTLRHELRTGNAPTYWLRFNLTGDLLATGGEDGYVRIWDPVTGTLLQDLLHDPDQRRDPQNRPDPIYALDFHPSGDFLISADRRGVVARWDLDVSDVTRTELESHSGAVYRVTFSPDGASFVTGDSDGNVRLWDSGTGTQRLDLGRPHYASVWPTMFHPHGDQILTTSNDHTAKLWNTGSGARLRRLRGHGRRIRTVAFSFDSRLLATADHDGLVRTWDPRTGVCHRVFEHPPDRLRSAVFAPRSHLLATESNDGLVFLWDAMSGKEGRHLGVDTENVWAVAFAPPEGDRMATVADDDSIEIRYAPTGRITATLRGTNTGRVRALAFSPDGESLASGSDDQTVRLWSTPVGDTTPDEPRAVFSGHSGRITSLAYSPHETLLASAATDGEVHLWDTQDGGHRRTILPGIGEVWSVAFSPDGRTLATAGDGGRVVLWDVATGAEQTRLTGHATRVQSVTYSPDGALIATGGRDGTTRIWQAGPGGYTHRVTLLGFKKDKNTPLDDEENGWAAFTPDGRYKVSSPAVEKLGQLWHIVGMCRFELDELDRYLEKRLRQDPDEPLF
jgi:WD40 repeat protein/3',5'-cyclic AMP phosphodiesterase CpdA